MGGFQFNGCGAKDYFSKVKYLGEQMCPNCKKIAPFYLEKGNFKVSVFWIPTVTLKERYAIMCEKCKEGKWIEDAEAYKILNGNGYTPNERVSNSAETSLPKCPQCGAAVDGVFCSKCGTKYSERADNKCESKKICSKCGSEVDGAFCGICGTKYISTKETTIPIEEPPKLKCSNCDAEVDGDFCGKCGAKHLNNSDVPIETDEQSKDKTVPQQWECSLCGTKNPQESSKCSLCGCEK